MKAEKNNLPAISVIIPMYNCERFVPEVLAMFSEQSFHDFELICVIDGATDNTEETVKKICETDHRFSYLVRENGGAGAARNTGIDHAKGKYIIFSDADDDYHKDYLLKLYETAEMNQADIAVCGAVTFDHITCECLPTSGFDKSRLAEGEVYSSKTKKHIFNMIDVQISNRLFLLKLLKNNEIRFSETVASNDVFFSKASIVCADRIVVIHDDLITIRKFVNPGSISSGRGNHSHIALTELQKLFQWLRKNDLINYYMADYLRMFDYTANYEMKNGVNAGFAKEMARILNSDEPWKDLNSQQIKQVLASCFGSKGKEKDRKHEDITDINVIRLRNKITKERNDNRQQNFDLIKREFLEQYGRDLDNMESMSPLVVEELKNQNIVGQNKSDHVSNKTDQPEITVVIPMYNCAEYVNNVLSMFSGQSISDFEVVCVIDGATDATEELVRTFCGNDERFGYVVQENMGPGAARNTGMGMARGRYIIFSDADDEYSVDYLKNLYETAVRHDAEIVVSRYLVKNNLSDKALLTGFNENIFCENVPYSHLGIENIFMSFTPRVTNKLFNAGFLKNNGISFPSIRVSEDALFSYKALSLADRIYVKKDPLLSYRFCINPDSLSVKHGSLQHEAVEELRLLYKWLEDHSLMYVHKEDYMNRVNCVAVFEGGFASTPRFIFEFSHFLNAEEPLKSIAPEDIVKYVNEGMFAENAARKENELKNRICPQIIEADKELSYLLDRYQNRIHTSGLLRRVSEERFGRVFSLPEPVQT